LNDTSPQWIIASLEGGHFLTIIILAMWFSDVVISKPSQSMQCGFVTLCSSFATKNPGGFND
jgi:hypothetical protein